MQMALTVTEGVVLPATTDITRENFSYYTEENMRSVTGHKAADMKGPFRDYSYLISHLTS